MAGTYSVSGLESEVVVLDVEVEVRKDELQRVSFGIRAHITARESERSDEPLHESSSR